MLPVSGGLLGAVAVSLTFGAVQFASGHDPSETPQAFSSTSSSSAMSGGINRSAKADRVAPASAALAPTRTISIRLDSLSDTSIVVRVPLTLESRINAPVPPTPIGGNQRKLTAACEPVVSTLTEVAKLLQPGRCVT
jgi:hypothetical protein